MLTGERRYVNQLKYFLSHTVVVNRAVYKIRSREIPLFRLKVGCWYVEHRKRETKGLRVVVNAGAFSCTLSGLFLLPSPPPLLLPTNGMIIRGWLEGKRNYEYRHTFVLPPTRFCERNVTEDVGAYVKVCTVRRLLGTLKVLRPLWHFRFILIVSKGSIVWELL